MAAPKDNSDGAAAPRVHYSDNPSIFPLEGGCACGRVRYRVEKAPLIVHCCHCTVCQRETGSAFALNAVIESPNVTALPPTKKVTSPPCPARPTEQKPVGPPLAPDDDGGSIVEPSMIRNPSESGFGQMFARCPTCATAIWSYYAGAGPVLKFVRVGTLDRAWEIAPDVHIFTESKRDFVSLDDGKPQYGYFYATKDEVYRKEALQRWAAVEGDVAKYREEKRRLGPKFWETWARERKSGTQRAVL